MFIKTNNKELPLLFSGPMVLASMEGIKTVTRRIINPQPPDYIDYFYYYHSGTIICRPVFMGYVNDTVKQNIKAKYARGDRIWARETWGIISYDNNSGYEIAIQYKADNRQSGIINLDNEEQWERFISSQENFEKSEKYIKYSTSVMAESMEPPILWRPSIYLPRLAARLFLNVTDVRIERLHELDDTEARKEGFKDRESFIKYWNKLNARRSYPWESNPWVYRIEFEKAA
jgi:hypothetical protein